jgi:MOSC domain-containing protein YiiM
MGKLLQVWEVVFGRVATASIVVDGCRSVCTMFAGMKTIRDLNAPPYIVGRVETIIVRGAPRDPARRVVWTHALAGIGLEDDRLGQRGEAELSTRQVTLIQAEHLPVIAQLARVANVDPICLRRNLVVSGINLLALKNARVHVGHAVIEIVGPCQPCSRMEEAIGPGGYAAMRGHGGMTARILDGGRIREGDPVHVMAEARCT